MNREELIEEAAKGMYAPRAWSEAGEAHRSRYRSMARSALAVFEQAHTPTEECNCAPGPDGVVIHNSWAHEQAHTTTDDEMRAEVERVQKAAWAEVHGQDPMRKYSVGEVKRLVYSFDNVLGSLLARRTVKGDAPGWSTHDRREAMAEAHRRFDEWAVTRGPDLANASINGFALGAEWQKSRRTVQGEYRGATPPDAGERADVRALVQGEPSLIECPHWSPGNGETPPAPKRRLRSCVEQWPECETGAYDPACCRFPKSCSATVYDESRVTEADLEPAPDREDGSER